MSSRSKKSWKPTLSLDFDGVFHSYKSGWKGARNIPDPPVPGAVEFLDKAVNHFSVAVFSSRSRYWGGRRAMKKYIKLHARLYYAKLQDIDLMDRFYEDHLDFLDEDQARALVGKLSFPLHKPAAMVGLDDRVMQFTGEWPDMSELTSFKPWNKK